MLCDKILVVINKQQRGVNFMSKYQSITIKKAMNNVATNQYFLPAIQRKFVWEMNQIEMLFDSILRDYPINSFMYWKITDESIKQNYKFYTFIKDYACKFHDKNPDAPTPLLSNDFYAVIDGQQRLTSLYIGLVGSYRVKRPNKRWKDNEDSMPTRNLYLELTSPLSMAIDNEKIYNFKFLTQDEIKNDKKNNPTHYWFPVSGVLHFKNLSDVNAYAIHNGLLSNNFAVSTLANLFNKINNEEMINYYVVEEQDQDKVLDIFLRTNSGGTPLSFSDLLMSIASANWTRFDARDEMQKVREEIYTFGNPCFDVSQDFILKSILVLSDLDIRFKIRNFGKSNIAIFESKWNEIRKSLVATFQLLEQLGFNDSLLRAKNASIPVAYYIYKNNLAESIVKTTYDPNDKINIAKWLAMSLLKGTFGGQSDGVLKSIRDVIKSSTTGKFPIQEIFDKFRLDPDKNYVFDDAVIQSFLEEEYGSSTAGLVLGLLYPDVILSYGKAVAEDHMHPKVQFENKSKLSALGLTPTQEEFYKNKKNYNSVLNLQLLDESRNKSKGDSPLKDWAKSNGKTAKDLYVKECTDLDIKSFEDFIKDRKELLTSKLKSILSV